MKELIEKIENYEIMTALIPGILFMLLFEYLTKCSIQKNGGIGYIFVGYFIGLVISRIGSLIIKPVLFKFTKEAGENYDNYINACKVDTTIITFSKVKNMYRNLITMCILLCICYIAFKIDFIRKIPREIIIISALIGITIILSVSFLKINKDISYRIRKANMSNKNK